MPTLATAIAPVVALVSQTNYQHYLDTLLHTRMGDNRGPAGAQHDLARSNIFNHFTSLGLQTQLDPFPYQEQTFYNVVGVLPGTTARSNEVYIASGHYDSVDNPGADDDASGVAGVMEAARVLSQYRFGATVIFIAFDLEEVDLVGSKSFATQHQSNSIGGVVSLDMIAHNSNAGNATAIYGKAEVINKGSNSSFGRRLDDIVPVTVKLVAFQVYPLHLLVRHSPPDWILSTIQATRHR